jgi:hypothetical protein
MFTNEEYVFFPLTKLKLGPKPLNWAGQCDPFHQLLW